MPVVTRWFSTPFPRRLMASPGIASSWRKQYLHKKKRPEEQNVSIRPQVVINNPEKFL